MTETELHQRQAVIQEAISWLNTPYHHQGRLKGVGVDCAMLVAEVYERAGLASHIPTPEYPPDWHLHRGEERFMDIVLQFGRDAVEALPGSLVMFRFGRCRAHGAIIVQWPLVIHAWRDVGHVEYVDVDESRQLKNRLAGFFTHKSWER